MKLSISTIFRTRNYCLLTCYYLTIKANCSDIKITHKMEFNCSAFRLRIVEYTIQNLATKTPTQIHKKHFDWRQLKPFFWFLFFLFLMKFIFFFPCCLLDWCRLCSYFVFTHTLSWTCGYSIHTIGLLKWSFSCRHRFVCYC